MVRRRELISHRIILPLASNEPIDNPIAPISPDSNSQLAIMDNHSSPIAAQPVRRRVTTRIPGKKTMTWDTKADQQLLLAILAAHEVKIDFEAVASRLGERCTPRAVVERMKKLKKRAIAQDSCAPSAPMATAPPHKKRKRVVLVENISKDIASAADGLEKSTQTPISAVSTASAGNGSAAVHPTEDSSTETTSTSGKFANNKPFGRGLLPMTHKQAVGTSYSQRAISVGQILLEERSQDKLHKVQIFSSQKGPQPFLDR